MNNKSSAVLQLNKLWYEYYQEDWKWGQTIINDKIYKQQVRHLEIQWEEKTEEVAFLKQM